MRQRLFCVFFLFFFIFFLVSVRVPSRAVYKKTSLVSTNYSCEQAKWINLMTPLVYLAPSLVYYSPQVRRKNRKNTTEKCQPYACCLCGFLTGIIGNNITTQQSSIEREKERKSPDIEYINNRNVAS